MTRNEAKRAGLQTYNTGVACARGHLSDRFTSSGDCIQCVKERTKEFRATPEGAKAKRKWERERIARKAATDAAFAQKLAEAKRRRNNAPDFAERKLTRAKQHRRVEAQKRDAKKAAELLTTTLGVPHTIIETEKGFQPVPA